MADSDEIPELLDGKQVIRMVKTTRKTLNRWMKAGLFPKPILPNRWRKDEVIETLGGQKRTFSDI